MLAKINIVRGLHFLSEDRHLNRSTFYFSLGESCKQKYKDIHPFDLFLLKIPPRGRGYLRNFWVGMCRWDPGILSLYQCYFSCILLLYTSVNSPNHSYPRLAVFQKLRSLAKSKQSQTKTLYQSLLSQKGFN